MRIGVPREIKPDEHRVGLSPAAVRELIAHGHEVVVQAQAEDPHLSAGALRLRLGTAPDQVVWGGSRITTTLTLPTGP